MKFLFGIIFLISVNATAQVNSGARFTAMASTGVSISDLWSVHQNQAGIATVKRLSLAIAFEKPFTGYDLSSQSVALIMPLQSNVFGLSVQQYGNASYRYQKAGFSYAKSFGGKLLTALTFNYHGLKIDNYGSAQFYSVEAGMQYRTNRALSVGAHVTTPGLRNPSRDISFPLRTRVQVGASYRFSEKVLLAMTIDKPLREKVDARTGAEYQIVRMLALRGGFSANPFRQYGGFGIKFKALNMDLSVSSQPIVGYSPQIAISYEM